MLKSVFCRSRFIRRNILSKEKNIREIVKLEDDIKAKQLEILKLEKEQFDAIPCFVVPLILFGIKTKDDFVYITYFGMESNVFQFFGGVLLTCFFPIFLKNCYLISKFKSKIKSNENKIQLIINKYTNNKSKNTSGTRHNK